MMSGFVAQAIRARGTDAVLAGTDPEGAALGDDLGRRVSAARGADRRARTASAPAAAPPVSRQMRRQAARLAAKGREV
jgi:hypothetical protein